MRIDGMLVDYLDLNKNIQAALIVRIKILSKYDIAEKDYLKMVILQVLMVELNIRIRWSYYLVKKIVMRY